MVKDKIPAGVKKWDVDISHKIYNSVPKTDKNKQIFKAIDISCHNVLWITVTIIGLYTSTESVFFRHLMVGIISDIIYVAVIKAYSRRVRPSFGSDNADKKDDNLIAKIDKNSFPSGHASRAVYFATLISNYYLNDGSLVSLIVSSVVYFWAFSVSASKVMTGRNHILDVLAGIVLGKVNHFIQFSIGSPINAVLMMTIKIILSSEEDDDFLR